jgi:ComF family protein
MLFQQNCLCCKQSSQNSICQYCRQDLSLFDLDQYQHNLMFMPKVKDGLLNVNFLNVVALGDYQWPLSKLLTGLKFSAYMPNAYALATLFVEHCLKTMPTKPQLMIPMPLHNNRYLFRKFNQSTVLAKNISLLSQVKMDTSIMLRSKPTLAQTDLSSSQRRKNLRNAFKLSDSGLKNLHSFQHIALFDDVITTGTTMNCAYKTLRKHHPLLKIDIWCICLTLLH